jgi:hypothetical protein
MRDALHANAAQDSSSRHGKLLVFSIGLIIILCLGFVFIRNLIDFPVYYAAGRSLIGGRNDLYSPDFAAGRVMDYRYPPFFLLALTPLWLLPYTPAAYLWYVLEVLQIAGCAAILRRVAGSRTWKIWLITTLAVGQYYVMVLHYGNAHLITVFLMFAAFYLAFKEKSLLAALAMSLAITIKLTPVLLLPYFALKGKKRFLLLTGVLLFAINLAPAAYFGFNLNTELLKTWFGHVVVEQEFHEANGPINLSLKGQLRRYFTRVDYSERVDGDVQYPAVNVASLTALQTDAAWLIIAVTVFASALAFVWKTSPRSRGNPAEMIPWLGDRLPLEFGLMICVCLLAGPLTSKIYFIALLWPVACLASLTIRNAPSDTRFGYRVLQVIAVVNCVLPLLPGRSVQRLLLVLGVDFYVNCLLLAALTHILSSSRSSVER